MGGWIQYATQIEEAGADAIECNIYWIVTDPNMTSAEVEQHYIDIVQAVKTAVHIPVAIKLSPFFSNFANMAKRLDAAGADGLVLFNRFYQPDIDLEASNSSSRPAEHTTSHAPAPYMDRDPPWQGQSRLAATSGIHGAEDVIKLLMVGANVTMLCSSLLRNGVNHLRASSKVFASGWNPMNISQSKEMQGSMSQLRCADPSAFERAQYMRAVKGIQHVTLAHEPAR